jgi:hypothetical protein
VYVHAYEYVHVDVTEKDEMHITHRALRFGAACVLLVGCGEDIIAPSSDEEATLDADLAAVAGEGAVSFMGLFAFNHAIVPSPPFARNLRIKYFDDAGNEQPLYHDLETASVNLRVTIDSELSRDGWNASVDREIDLTVSGLLGRETTRIWNGTASGTLETRHTDNDETRSYHITSNTIIDDVVVPAADPHWPSSGTITDAMAIRWTRDGQTVTTERTVTVTFNGTRNPSVTVDGQSFQ